MDKSTIDIPVLALTAEQAAVSMSVSKPTFEQMLHTPGFPAFRAGRKWIIPVRELQDWMTKMVQENAELK